MVPSQSSLQDLGAALWDLHQHLHPAYAEHSERCGSTVTEPGGSGSGSSTTTTKASAASTSTAMAIATAASALPRRMLALPPSFPDELNALHRLLAFPEEVALKLTETEYELFNRVPPVDYLRHCTTDLTSRAHHQQQSKPPENGVPSLIRRFNEVSPLVSFIRFLPVFHLPPPLFFLYLIPRFHN